MTGMREGEGGKGFIESWEMEKDEESYRNRKHEETHRKYVEEKWKIEKILTRNKNYKILSLMPRA